MTRYPALDSQLFVDHRERILAQLPPDSMAIVHSNDVMPTSADGIMGFSQNSSLYY
ncbi:MAG: aminopeptidase P N-terminal domain-containing protein, partial [Verrucomicrobiota bacterium]